jgi:hypothetical protein
MYQTSADFSGWFRLKNNHVQQLTSSRLKNMWFLNFDWREGAVALPPPPPTLSALLICCRVICHVAKFLPPKFYLKICGKHLWCPRVVLLVCRDEWFCLYVETSGVAYMSRGVVLLICTGEWCCLYAQTSGVAYMHRGVVLFPQLLLTQYVCKLSLKLVTLCAVVGFFYIISELY